MRLTTFCGLFFCALLAAGPVHAQQLVVDCDAGDDLAQALEQAVSSSLTSIAVEGTCEGNFELESPVNIRIEGRDATLVSPDEGIVFRIGGPGRVKLDGFEIRSGHFGVLSAGADALVSVVHCEVRDNIFGLASTEGATVSVSSSDIHDNEIGLFCEYDSKCFASHTTIRDNHTGAAAKDQSDLETYETEISGSIIGGALVLERSKASFSQSTFLENGSFHIALVDRSQIFLQNSVILGGPGDGTPLALAVSMLSSAETSPVGLPVQFFGDVLARDSSYLILNAAQVSGDVEIVDFAEVKLVGSTVAGSVLCQSGGDAVCGEGSSARINGCASARPHCSPHPSNRQTRHAEVLDRVERYKSEDASEPGSALPSRSPAEMNRRAPGGP